jgi:chemotaxis protein histidine kinase CheA
MMNTYSDRFLELQQRFLVGLNRRVEDLTTTLSVSSDPEPLMQMFHSLTGIGGTYGFPRITDISRSCEALCVTCMEEHRTITLAEKETLLTAVVQIQESVLPIAA